MLIPSGAVYLDVATENDSTVTPTCINAFPYAGQEGVPAADALGSHALHITVVDVGTAGLSAGDTKLYVTTVDEGLIEVFDGTSFHANWTNSSYSPVASDGGATIDEHRFILIRDTPFVSLDVVNVRVVAETTIAETLDKTYAFTIEDLTKPELLEVKTRGLDKLRVIFNEPMLKETDALGDVLFVRNISGGIAVVAPVTPDPPRVAASRDIFSPSDVGLYLGIAGAENALNNDIFQIVSFISAREVEISSPDILNEELTENALVTISPYRVDGVPDAARVNPYFNPIVLSAECIADDEIELTLHTEITQQREYLFYALGVQDLNENVLDPVSIEFTTEPCGAPSDRDFSILDMVPDENLRQDATRDLERYLRVLDEVLQLILCDVDNWTSLLDIDQIADDNLDAMLLHLGAPFSFAGSLSAEDKRRLASVLVEMYKRKGGEVAIEAIVSFILGIDIDVQPFLNPAGTWTLGVSVLGGDAILGPGTSFLRYSFQVESFQDLTEVQRRRLIEIVNYMKPAHTHFIRLIEPTTPPVTVFTPWELGVDLLGESTILG